MTPANLPVGIEPPSGFLLDPALIDALCAETEPAEKLKRLKQLRLQAEKGRAWVKEQADNLDQIYTEIAQSDAYAEHVIRLAQIVLEKRYSAAERLMPGIEELRQKLAVRGERLGPEMQPFQESVDTDLIEESGTSLRSRAFPQRLERVHVLGHLLSRAGLGN